MPKDRLYARLIIFQLIVIFLGLTLSGRLNAQTREYLLKSGYIEKFTRFIEWNGNRNSGDSLFRIAVIGDKRFKDALNAVFEKVKVNNKIVEVKLISSVDQVQDSRIVVISGILDNQALDKLLNYTTGRQILTIGEVKGYGRKGVIINMVVLDNFIRYEINKETLDKSGLKISSLLLNSAIILKPNE